MNFLVIIVIFFTSFLSHANPCYNQDPNWEWVSSAEDTNENICRNKHTLKPYDPTDDVSTGTRQYVPRHAGGGTFKGRQGPVQQQRTAASTPAELECEKFDIAIKQCEEQTISAENDCDVEKSDSMSQAISSTRSGLNVFQQMSSQNPAMACSNFSEIVKGAYLAFSAFEGRCTISATACSDSCKEAQNIYNSSRAQINSCDPEGVLHKLYSEAKSSCSLAGRKASTAKQDLEAALNADKQAVACASSAGVGVGGLLSASDCSNPQVAATNLVCVCKINPRDPRCTGVNSGFGSGITSNAGGGIDSVASPNGGLDKNTKLGSSDLDFASLGPDGVVGGGGPGPNNRANPNSGAAMGPSGDGGLKPGQKPNQNGSAGSSFNTKVNSGYVGGGAAAGSFGSNRGGSNSGGNYAAGSAGGNQKVDLRQFLPGGQMDATRGLAGVSGPDGITGPHSNLWQKVNNRYRNVSPGMMP